MLTASRKVWEGLPKRVIVPYAKLEAGVRIRSSEGHEESRMKTGGTPSKPKYYLVIDSVKVL